MLLRTPLHRIPLVHLSVRTAVGPCGCGRGNLFSYVFHGKNFAASRSYTGRLRRVAPCLGWLLPASCPRSRFVRRRHGPLLCGAAKRRARLPSRPRRRRPRSRDCLRQQWNALAPLQNGRLCFRGARFKQCGCDGFAGGSGRCTGRAVCCSPMAEWGCCSRTRTAPALQ